MAQTKTDVCNLALTHVGGAPPFLVDVASDTSKEAKLFRQVVDESRRVVLRTHPWNFAMDRAKFVLKIITNCVNNGVGLIRVTAVGHGRATSDFVTVAEVMGTAEANGQWTITVINVDNFDLQGSAFANTYASGGVVGLAPTFGFIFKHPLPVNFIRLIDIDPTLRPEFEVEGAFIVTDETVLEVRYVRDIFASITDYSTMDATFYQVLALHLAWSVSYPLTQSSRVKESLWENFTTALGRARNQDSTEAPRKTMSADLWDESRLSGSFRPDRNPLP